MNSTGQSQRIVYGDSVCQLLFCGRERRGAASSTSKRRVLLVNNALSQTVWANLTALCLPLDQLKNKHGVTWLHPRNSNEIRLAAGDYTLAVVQQNDGISAVIENRTETAPMAPQRTFAIDGTVECPVLIESGSATSQRISEVFEELMNWLGFVAEHTRN